MKAQSTVNGIRPPALSRYEAARDACAYILEDEDEAPCSEYVVMHEQQHLPALQEFLREYGAQTIR